MAKPKVTVGAVLKKASEKAFRGGMAGFCAGIVQVASFMWMRTAMNYQYANGGNMIQVRIPGGVTASCRARLARTTGTRPVVSMASVIRDEASKHPPRTGSIQARTRTSNTKRLIEVGGPLS